MSLEGMNLDLPLGEIVDTPDLPPGEVIDSPDKTKPEKGEVGEKGRKMERDYWDKILDMAAKSPTRDTPYRATTRHEETGAKSSIAEKDEPAIAA